MNAKIKSSLGLCGSVCIEIPHHFDKSACTKPTRLHVPFAATLTRIGIWQNFVQSWRGRVPTDGDCTDLEIEKGLNSL